MPDARAVFSPPLETDMRVGQGAWRRGATGEFTLGSVGPERNHSRSIAVAIAPGLALRRIAHVIDADRANEIELRTAEIDVSPRQWRRLSRVRLRRGCISFCGSLSFYQHDTWLTSFSFDDARHQRCITSKDLDSFYHRSGRADFGAAAAKANFVRTTHVDNGCWERPLCSFGTRERRLVSRQTLTPWRLIRPVKVLL